MSAEIQESMEMEAESMESNIDTNEIDTEDVFSGENQEAVQGIMGESGNIDTDDSSNGGSGGSGNNGGGGGHLEAMLLIVTAIIILYCLYRFRSNLKNLFNKEIDDSVPLNDRTNKSKVARRAKANSALLANAVSHSNYSEFGLDDSGTDEEIGAGDGGLGMRINMVS